MDAIISPMMQHDFVTKKEFGEFKDEMHEFKDEMHVFKGEMYEFKDEMHEFREDVNERFDGVDKRFDSLEKNLVIFKDEIKDHFKHSIGAMHEKFRNDLHMGLEYVQEIDKNKVDKKDFEVVRQQVSDFISSRKK